MKLALRGALGVVGARPPRPAAVGLRPRVLALHARLHHHLPRHPRRRARGPRRLPAGAAADAAARATSRSRSTSRSTSRRCRPRSSARSKPSAAAPARRIRRRSFARWSSRRSRSASAIESGRRVERVPVRRYGADARRARRLAAIALFVLGPAYLRHALSALFIVSRDVEAAAPYRIEVTPGNATVPRGADQTVTAQLSGFDAEQASLHDAQDAGRRRSSALPLLRGDERQVRRHAVRPRRRRSSTSSRPTASAPKHFTLKVVDLPYVQRLELEYHFPAYTGLAPQKIEDGGDIAVLKGTEVRVRAVPTMSRPADRSCLSDKERIALAPAAEGGSPAPLTGAFKVDKDGFYRIELDAPSGERVTASPQYTIDVLDDQPPTVSISKPGRDTSASPIEEVFVEARADDDFGVQAISISCTPSTAERRRRIRLFDGKKRMTEVSGGHTFYLEELDVKPGDFVSYYAKAADNDGVQGPKPAMSDMYFVRVRPLSKEFRRAPVRRRRRRRRWRRGRQNQVGALSEQQRQIIAATFNVQRDRKKMTADKLRENSIVIALSQSRLREQVDGLLTRMNSRLVEQDPAFKKIAELLPQAVTEMKTAEAKLQASVRRRRCRPSRRRCSTCRRRKKSTRCRSRSSASREAAAAAAAAADGAGSRRLVRDGARQDGEPVREPPAGLAAAVRSEARRAAGEAEGARAPAGAGSGAAAPARRARAAGLRRRIRTVAARARGSGGGSGAPARAVVARGEPAGADAVGAAAARGGRRDAQGGRQRSAGIGGAGGRGARAAAGGGAAAAADDSRGAPIATSRTRCSRPRSSRASSGHCRRRKGARVGGRPAPGKGAAAHRAEERARAEGRRAREAARSDCASDIRGAGEGGSAQAGRGGRIGIRDNKVRDKIRYSSSMLRAGVPPTDQQAIESSIGSNLDSLKRHARQAASALGTTDRRPTR